jgi:integrase
VGNGAGTVYPRRNKEGKIIGYLGSYFDRSGKRRYVSAKRKNDCRTELRKAMSDADQGIVFDAKGQTVGQWLEKWLEDVVRPNKTHRTHAAHRQQARTHIIPALGHIKLDALRKAHVDRLYARLLRPEPEGAGLAPSSVRRIHAVLHAALEEAVVGELIPRNPARHANKPKVRQEEIEPLNAGHARKLLDAARKAGDRYEALYALCLLCALRQGEALALRWSDIDLDAGSLYVVRQLQRVRRDGDVSGTLEFSEPKNASRRKVGLPQRAVEALQRHAERQAREWRPPGTGTTIRGSSSPPSPAARSTPRTS